MPSEADITSVSAAVKHAGFDNFPAFLLSYGLKIYNDDDVQEGKAILTAMGYGINREKKDDSGKSPKRHLGTRPQS